MALVNSKKMFEQAAKGGYAIGAFNVNNMEIVQGITEACKETNSPVILQVSKGARAYANHTYLVNSLRLRLLNVLIFQSFYTLTTVLILKLVSLVLTVDLLQL